MLDRRQFFAACASLAAAPTPDPFVVNCAGRVGGVRALGVGTGRVNGQCVPAWVHSYQDGSTLYVRKHVRLEGRIHDVWIADVSI